ncbi:hypothetical protein, partial [Bacteroides heparinolyticus]
TQQHRFRTLNDKYQAHPTRYHTRTAAKPQQNSKQRCTAAKIKTFIRNNTLGRDFFKKVVRHKPA